MADKDKEEKTEAKGAPEVPKHVAEDLDAKEPKKPEPEEDAPETEETKDTAFDDDQTDEAINDIVKTESDDLLAAQDKETTPAVKQSKHHWWKSGRFWKWTFIILAITLSVLFAIESTRHWMLNALGVRASASVIVLDSTTGEPLKNVQVTIDQQSAKTDVAGKAQVFNLELGNQTLQLERAGFAEQKHTVTIGWGSNPLGTYKLKATGAQYKLHVVDYLSATPIAGAEASNVEAAAVSNKDGQVVLTLEDTTAEEVTITVAANGYRSEQVTVSLEATEPAEVVLVPSNKAVFVTKETGKYDLYTMDIDGKDKKILLPATGRETGNISVVVSPDGQQVALVSTRDDVRTADGMLLTTLTLVDVATGNTVAIDRGEQLQVLDWIDNRVVYHMVVPGQAADNSNRQRIVSYDYKVSSRAQLATANQIRSAASAQGKVYFTDGSNYFRINPDGTSKQSLLDKGVWATYRTDYDSLSLQTETGWYRVTLASGAVVDIPEPATYANRVYTLNTKGDQTVWAEKGNLHLFVIASAKDAVLHTQGGLNYPLRWLTNTDIIYRVALGSDIADFAVSTLGGEPRKLTNVTATFGAVQSY